MPRVQMQRSHQPSQQPVRNSLTPQANPHRPFVNKRPVIGFSVISMADKTGPFATKRYPRRVAMRGPHVRVAMALPLAVGPEHVRPVVAGHFGSTAWTARIIDSLKNLMRSVDMETTVLRQLVRAPSGNACLVVHCQQAPAPIAAFRQATMCLPNHGQSAANERHNQECCSPRHS